MMEHKLRKESIEWFENSKRSVTLMKDFIDDRLQLEEQVESMWTTFHEKWHKKFYDHEDPMKVTSKQSLGNIMRFMVEETRDNSVISCRVKSSLKRKRQSPSYVLKRWLFDPMENTTCIDVQEFRDCYLTNDTNMAEHEKKANKSLQTFREKITALQQVAGEWERLPYSDINRSIALARKEDEREMEMERAKDSYQRAVRLHRQAQQPYIQNMNYLKECLESFERNRLATMQKAARLYINAINQYETQRQNRQERVELLLEFFDSLQIGESVQNWIVSIQEPCSFSIYLEDYQVLELSRHMSLGTELQPQTQRHPQHGVQPTTADGSRDARPADGLSSESQIDLEAVTSEEFTEEVIQDGKSVNADKMFKSTIEHNNVTVRIPVEPALKPVTQVIHVKEALAFGTEDQPKSAKAESRDYNTASPADLETFCQMSVSQPQNVTAMKFEGQITPDIGVIDAAWELSSESQMAIEDVENKEFTEELNQDGRSINTKKWFKSRLGQIDDNKIPVKPAYKPLSREAQAFEIEDDQPDPVKTESDTSEASDATEVSRAAHVKVCALESYTSLLPGHLSFHTGQKIKQKEAANEEGLAYGYIIKNKYTRKRTYGLYPVRLVALKVPSKKRRLKNFFRKK